MYHFIRKFLFLFNFFHISTVNAGNGQSQSAATMQLQTPQSAGAPVQQPTLTTLPLASTTQTGLQSTPAATSEPQSIATAVSNGSAPPGGSSTSAPPTNPPAP